MLLIEENIGLQDDITDVIDIIDIIDNEEIADENLFGASTETTVDSMPLTNDVGRTNGTFPRGRERSRRRSRNSQRAAGTTATSMTHDADDIFTNTSEATSEDIRSLNPNAGLSVRGRSGRGRPSRRGRRGRLARSNHIEIQEVEEIASNVEESERSMELIASIESIGNDRNEIVNEEIASNVEESERSMELIANVESIGNDRNEIVNEEIASNVEESERSMELIASVESIENERNEIMNEDESIFDIPADDYGVIDLDDDEQDDLPFYPAPLGPVSASSSERIRGTCCTCLNTTADHIFVPCGHLCICSDCVPQLENHKCPLCREEYFYCIRAITT